MALSFLLLGFPPSAECQMNMDLNGADMAKERDPTKHLSIH
jgi:hypothetical protein